jgi:endo-1,4-beta-xylanase
MFNRRHLLWGLGVLSNLFFFIMADHSARSQSSIAAEFATAPQEGSGDEPLRDRAARKGLNFGTFPVFYYDDLIQDQSLQALVIRECNLLVAGFYSSITRPDEASFDFTATDGFAEFAAEHGLLFRGHPLIWNQVNADWLVEKLEDSSVSDAEIRELFITHIATPVQRYAGRMHSWDVVNEAIGPHDGRADGLQDTPWLRRLGADYIELAFRTAAAADGNARLVYNDNGLEYDTPEHDRRRAAVLQLLRDLKAKEVPIHALGIQSHLNDYERSFNPDKVRIFLQEVADLGLEIMLTELDVTDQHLPANETDRDRLVANAYQEFLSVALEQPAVTTIVTWGLSDRQSWLADFAPREDGLLVRTLPFDTNFNRKMAWYAIAQVFDAAPYRSFPV